MTKTYTVEILENTRMQLLDQIDILNVANGNREYSGKLSELKAKLENVKASIKILNENRGIKITSESGTLILCNGGMKFVGNVDFTPAKPINEQSVTQNITFNIENVSKDVDINKFTKAFAETLKRQQGIR